MKNKDVLALFGLIEKYCESVNCNCCIIKYIYECECAYDGIGTPSDWIKIIEKELRK